MKSILEEAEELTRTDRAQQYGPIEGNAETAIKIFELIKGDTSLSVPSDVALFQFCHKLARNSYKYKRDNLVDAVGYLKLFHQLYLMEKGINEI